MIYDPLRDELFEARRGGGASLNGTPIRVSATARLTRALIATGFPYDIRERVPETLARLGRLLGIVQGLRRGGSAALDLCYVACGRLDGFYEENLKPWDTAAGLLIVTEAGGKITTFDGGDYDIYSPNILASNGVLHRELFVLVESGLDDLAFHLENLLTGKSTWDIKKIMIKYAKQLVLVARDGGLVRYVHRQV